MRIGARLLLQNQLSWQTHRAKNYNFSLSNLQNYTISVETYLHEQLSMFNIALRCTLVHTKGKTKGTNYFINPCYLNKYEFKGKTNLKRIEFHRLRELIREGLSIYPNSSISDINHRIGSEIPIRSVRAQLDTLFIDGIVGKKGEKRFTKYCLIS